MAFSKDFKTLIIGAKDGKIAFYNAHDNFKLIALMDAHKDMGVPLSKDKAEAELEVNALAYISMKTGQFLAVGTNQGQMCLVDMQTQKLCYKEN